MYTEQKIILAADELNKDSLLELVKKIGPRVYCVKIHNLYDKFGPNIIKILNQAGVKKIWVDFKLHDIPNTVKLRAQGLAESGCNIITVHASGGVEMLAAAKQGFGVGKIYAVTALTSLDAVALNKIYKVNSPEELVLNLASLVKESGVDGLVCSPKEIATIRSREEFKNLELVIPGIRSANVSTNDQQRFDTPENAIKAGADFLVIGRQITKAQDPLVALDLLEQELAKVITNV